MDRIAEAVRDHSFSRGAVPETALGRSLQDADRLEALGALGLFRCVSTGTRMGARYFADDDPFARERPLDDRAFSVDHFYAKLLGLPATMLTDVGRAEATRRAAFLEMTLAQLASELGEHVRLGTPQAARSGSPRRRSFCRASRSSWRTRSAEMPCLAPMSASLC